MPRLDKKDKKNLSYKVCLKVFLKMKIWQMAKNKVK